MKANDKLELDFFYEQQEDEAYANVLADDLRRQVKEIAPHIRLTVTVCQASKVEPWTVNVNGEEREAAQHAPLRNGCQSLLLTHRDFGAQGYGGPERCVVSIAAARSKESRGGDAVDIVIHEWIHTLVAQKLNGRTVPSVDDAEIYGYEGVPGLDGEDCWDDWFRRCLGGPGKPSDDS